MIGPQRVDGAVVLNVAGAVVGRGGARAVDAVAVERPLGNQRRDRVLDAALRVPLFPLVGGGRSSSTSESSLELLHDCFEILIARELSALLQRRGNAVLGIVRRSLPSLVGIIGTTASKSLSCNCGYILDSNS